MLRGKISRIAVFVKEDARDLRMPDDNYARELENYTWDDIKKLKKAISRQRLTILHQL